MKLTFYGHACVGVEVAGTHLLFDPYISENEAARHIDVATVPADYIFISHGHQDHIADARAIAKRTNATVVATFEVTQWLAKTGVRRLYPMNIGGTASFNFGRVRLVPAAHSSSMPDGTYGGNPVSFVVETPEGAFFVSGDTGLTSEMELVGRLVQLKFAALCMGGTYTMDVDDAVLAAKLLRVNTVVGIHYDTVPLLGIDHDRALARFDAASIRLILLQPGQACEF